MQIGPQERGAPLSAITTTKPILGITANGLAGFDTFKETQLAGASTVELNKSTVQLTDNSTLQNIILYGRGNRLNIATGKVLRMGASTSTRSLIFETTLSASGTGYLAVTKDTGAITGVPSVLQAPRLVNCPVTAPVQFLGLGEEALTLDKSPIGAITNNSQDSAKVATVYLLPGSSIDNVGPNINVVQVGGGSGSGTPGTGTARDPFAVDAAKRKAVVDAGLNLVLETDEAYYGKRFGDDVYGPDQPAFYQCIPFAPAQDGGATIWKWARTEIL